MSTPCRRLATHSSHATPRTRSLRQRLAAATISTASSHHQQHAANSTVGCSTHAVIPLRALHLHTRPVTKTTTSHTHAAPAIVAGTTVALQHRTLRSLQQQPQRLIVSRIAQEFRYLEEYLGKGSRQRRPKRKHSLAELEQLTVEDLRQYIAQREKQAKEAQAAALKAQQAAMEEIGKEQDEKDSGSESATSSPAAADTPAEPTAGTALMRVDNETEWDKRIDRLREGARNSILGKYFRDVRRHFARSDSVVARKYRETREEVQDALADAREVYETSQDPRINRLRSINDRIFGESEQAYALGELQQLDPDFNLPDFIEEMQEYMVPAVIKAYRRNSEADRLMLRTCIEDTAEAQFQGSWKERSMNHIQWDDRILDIRQLDVAKITVENNEPNIVLTFVCQHVNCVRNTVTKKVVEGSESDIQNVFYIWVVRRDFENELFNWKLQKFHADRMFALA